MKKEKPKPAFPIMTPLLFLVNILVYLYITRFFPLGTASKDITITYGLKRGSWWSFISYLFVHFYPKHLIFDSTLLMIFGTITELAIGVLPTTLIYLISGILGGVHFILFNNDILIGSSIAVWGLIGAATFSRPKSAVLGVILALVLLPTFDKLYDMGVSAWRQYQEQSMVARQEYERRLREQKLLEQQKLFEAQQQINKTQEEIEKLQRQYAEQEIGQPEYEQRTEELNKSQQKLESQVQEWTVTKRESAERVEEISQAQQEAQQQIAVQQEQSREVEKAEVIELTSKDAGESHVVGLLSGYFSAFALRPDLFAQWIGLFIFVKKKLIKKSI